MLQSRRRVVSNKAANATNKVHHPGQTVHTGAFPLKDQRRPLPISSLFCFIASAHILPSSAYLYCGTPCGGGPYPPCPPCIMTAGPWPPPPCICCCTSGLYLISWPKLQMWHPTSLYGLSEKGIMGTKQKVNHSQRFITCQVLEWDTGGGGGGAYAAGKVTAVLTLYGYVLGAGEGGVKDWVLG
jgi:hypothetical protein